MLYSDWEGNISLEFTASFEYKDQFNGGLRVVKDGKLAMNMENYPYNIGNAGKDEDNCVWSVELELEAKTDLTLLGCSALFCIGGINMAELSLLRIGMEAECKLAMKASTEKGIEMPNKQDSTYYLRGYLKVGEVKVRLKADINIFWHDWGFEFNFEYCLLDFTLFKIGNMPDKYRPKIPVSSKAYPSSFDSVITLVCDVSGSMDERLSTGETKLEALRQAGMVITDIVEELNKQYPGNYGIGVVQFSTDAKTLAFPHIDYPFIADCIQAMKDGGSTNITAGLKFGIEQLNNVKAANKVIILMTDGQDNQSSYEEIMKQAKDAKTKNIRVYTIGFGADADEKILTQVAEETDGEYRFADTDNIVGIIGSFIYAQQASGSKVLVDEQGTIAEGETTKATAFTVPDETGDLHANLYWPGSILDLMLIDPNGRTVDEDYPGAKINNSTIPTSVVIFDPLPGSWKMRVKGVETSYDEEPYYAITSFKKKVNLDLNDELETFELIGAYCLPIGVFMFMLCIMLLIFVNSKPKLSVT